MKRSNRAGDRRYSRMARVNELLREIIGDELERLDEVELEFVTVTGVDCAADLRHAIVFFDGPGDADSDDATIDALEEVRRRLQRAIATQARLKHTPELRFLPDPAVRSGEHIDAVLREVVDQTDIGDDPVDSSGSGGSDDRWTSEVPVGADEPGTFGATQGPDSFALPHSDAPWPEDPR